MSYHDSPIAVIGMALRAPGADTPEQFWDNLMWGRDTLSRPTESQLRRAGVPEHLIQDPNFIRSRAVLKDPGAFEPAFFGMSELDAKMADPCHRLFLTCAWEALERAGVVPGPHLGAVGVYGGGDGGPENYSLRNFGGGFVDMDDPLVWLPINLGNSLEHMTSRVCYHLNLKGPNASVMAACATSLVAVHFAVRALRHRDCDLALAGGATIAAPHWPGYLHVQGGPVSSTGTVWAFDERADGTVFGSGVGVVAMKRLEDAMEQGDYIHAVILGTAVFNDGGGKNSLAAPAIDGEMAAISRALEVARVGAETIEFIETHGTGTRMGDPIEVEATTQVFRRETRKTQYCALGAVKANIGHTVAAAGILGMIKTCMALEHGIIPPNIHFEHPNPRLNLSDSPFYIPLEPKSWQPDAHPRRAGVSSFGFGGNNAHAVLEAPPPRPARTRVSRPELIILSARTPTALESQVDRLKKHLRGTEGLCLEDVAHTLQAGRKAFKHRAAVVASNPEEAVQRLSDHSIRFGEAQDARPVIFAFPGQGSQRVGMGRNLYEEDPAYRVEVDRCAELLEPQLNLDIRSLLHEDKKQNAGQLLQTAIAQPALFVVEYALARRLMACGVEPAGMIGHSVGELVAACLSGVFSLPDALALVAQRGRLMQGCAPGSMMTVFLSEAETRTRLEDGLEIAAFNAPELTVVTGAEEAIDQLASRLKEEEVNFRKLHTSHGFHSASMDSAVEPFREAVAQFEQSAPRLPFASNVTGRLITDTEATDPDYWASHIRQPVRFAQGIETLQNMGEAVWVEVGPGSSLSNLIRRQTDGAEVISSLENNSVQVSGILEILSKLWVKGVPVNWDALEGDNNRRKVPLPTYPFETQNYWIEPPVYQPGEDSKKTKGTKTESFGEDEAWLHVPTWRELPPRKPSAPSREAGWLIFEDGTGLGAKLRAHLEKAGARVLSLKPGDAFEPLGDDSYSVRPGATDDLLAIMREGTESGWTPEQILHLWQVNDRGKEEDDPIRILDTCLEKGFHSLTALVQALDAHELTEEIQVTVVADGVVALDGEPEQVHWEKASMLGPCRVAPKEFSNLSFQMIDIPTAALNETWLAERLLEEVFTSDSGTLKALREGACFVEAFEPLPESLGAGGIRDSGVVLITGGMGGLGLEVAGRLFEMGRIRLALLSRWQPPPLKEWPARAKVDDRIGKALQKVLALKAEGAEVLIVQGDASDADSMQRVIDTVRQHYSALNGVVHAAGVVSPALMLESLPEQVNEVFGAKVKGALILEELLRAEPLDFFLYFSSVASVAPIRGQADYAGANAVLDALAKRDTWANCSRICSIGWDGWQKVGMLVDTAPHRMAAELPDLSKGPAGETVEHPLWQYCRHEKHRVLFVGVLRPSEHWVIDEHRLDGVAVMPGTGIVDMIYAAIQHLHGEHSQAVINDIQFRRFVRVPDEGLEVWLACFDKAGKTRFELRSCPVNMASKRLEDMILNTTGMFALLEEDVPMAKLPSGEWRTCGLHKSILTAGPHFHGLAVSESLGDEMALRISLPESYQQECEVYGLHPVVLDRALGHVPHVRLEGKGVPSTIGEIRIYCRLPANVTAVIRDVPDSDGAVSVIIANDQGEVVVEAIEYLQLPLSRDRDRTSEPQTRPGLTAEMENLKIPWSIPLQRGLDIFQELFQYSELPPHVIASQRSLDNLEYGHYPSIQKDDRPDGPPHKSTPAYSAPSNPIEEQIVEIWKRILSVDPLSVDDDFLELGGDSIASIQILSRIEKKLGVRLSLRILLDNPTPTLLSKVIEGLLEESTSKQRIE
jgi:acyl transferase domain-containing protein/acyl carrier protein